jgi:RND family efflux transporter MFP subunit
MMATGSPNVFGEAWTSLLGDAAHEYIANGSLIQVRDEVIVGAGEGWYVPQYTALLYDLKTIEDVIAEQGTVVASGQTQIMRLVSLEDMYIEAEIPEDYLTSVSENTPVTINFPILNKTVDSKVRQASNYISPANRTFRIEVAVPNKDKSIKPNLTARLMINDYTSEKALLIPLSVISENADGEQYVYIAEGEDTPVAKRQIIETGRSQGQNIEVLSGLSNGDFVIKEGARTVKEGQELQIKN